jgi:hypothetical protein
VTCRYASLDFFNPTVADGDNVRVTIPLEPSYKCSPTVRCVCAEPMLM